MRDWWGGAVTSAERDRGSTFTTGISAPVAGEARCLAGHRPDRWCIVGAVIKNTRERIMAVALDLFAERGVQGTPVTAIEAAAGLSPGSGSFYRHFRDRAELLTAVVEQEIARV